MNSDPASDYLDLIRLFLGGELSAGEFESQYLTLFKSGRAGMSLASYSTLDKLFAAVDAYCPDPSLRAEGDLDEGGLREAARLALGDLLAARSQETPGVS